MKIPDGECTVRVVDMAHDTGGFVAESPDGHITIYINARRSHADRQRVLKHELNHILNDDLHNDDDIATCEARADGQAADLPRLFRARDLLPPPVPPKPRRKKLKFTKEAYPTYKRWDEPGDITNGDFVDLNYHNW